MEGSTLGWVMPMWSRAHILSFAETSQDLTRFELKGHLNGNSVVIRSVFGKLRAMILSIA